jgi:CRISPR-associated protein (TIGR02584 family)
MNPDGSTASAATTRCRRSTSPPTPSTSSRTPAARPLEDIRSPDDNRRAADGITELIREFTADPDCALHVSIAGGRKTMGFFLGYALSLYGRPQDKLSHVLVSEPFESSSGFYYPTPASRFSNCPAAASSTPPARRSPSPTCLSSACATGCRKRC